MREWWTDSAIRDTVAAIASERAYQRAITNSWGSKIVRWIVDLIGDLLSIIGSTPHGRLITQILLAVLVVLIIARIALGIGAERYARREFQPRGTGVRAAAMLAEAERLAAAGDYTGAAHVLFAALLATGAARGELRLHPSKTTGDYARELRRRNASWLQSFQLFRSRYDRVIYGDMLCSADDYHALAREAGSVLTRERAG